MTADLHFAALRHASEQALEFIRQISRDYPVSAKPFIDGLEAALSAGPRGYEPGQGAAGWTSGLPSPKATSPWDSGRIGDYNQGWNDCLAQARLSLAGLGSGSSRMPQHADAPAADPRPIVAPSVSLRQDPSHPSSQLAASAPTEGRDPSAPDAWGTVDGCWVESEHLHLRADKDRFTIPLHLGAHEPPAPSTQPQCHPHPKAPHGFLRDASHCEDRYVCECEFWDPYEAGYHAGMAAASDGPASGASPQITPLPELRVKELCEQWAMEPHQIRSIERALGIKE